MAKPMNVEIVLICMHKHTAKRIEFGFESKQNFECANGENCILSKQVVLKETAYDLWQKVEEYLKQYA